MNEIREPGMRSTSKRKLLPDNATGIFKLPDRARRAPRFRSSTAIQADFLGACMGSAVMAASDEKRAFRKWVRMAASARSGSRLSRASTIMRCSFRAACARPGCVLDFRR